MASTLKHPTASIYTSTIPVNVQQALSSPEWLQAMKEEYQALFSNDTWELVPREPHMNTVANKWIFRIKYNANGSLQRHKARLVPKGFQQQPGIDFFETFSPVVKP
ncbi:uncharacterized mitochondrial protein AtMg00820-like [Humulus lupulus]|uniref:uncharacterized mitochondrial protein AtMg00820-like n=1 Tax=Humulus lupulus TaxID=3486 RepID=UPI002B409DC0|nr:uncharacterized mitochondrial protein AtMg00820-like [Humulus lupulus]